MKLRRMLVFSAVIVSLALVAIAARPEVKEYTLKFTGEGQFGMYPDGDLWVFFPTIDGLNPVPDSLNVSHLGLSEVDWEIRVNVLAWEPIMEVEFVDGWFTITGANGRDGLSGDYSGFDLDGATGEYDLEWDFTGGTGRFEEAEGTGHTDGLSNLLTGEAEFEFSGEITVPKGNNSKALITSVVRDGVTDGQPTIVAGPDPDGLQETSHAFMDRPINEHDTRNYHWQSIPAELIGADYVMTYNEDKRPVYDPEVYSVSYAVTLGKAAKLYIFVDQRYVDAHAPDPPFAWLTDGSSGAVFEDTGLDIELNEVGGRDVLQPFDVYGAQVPAGTYILGPSCDGNGSRNFYAIAAAKN